MALPMCDGVPESNSMIIGQHLPPKRNLWAHDRHAQREYSAPAPTVGGSYGNYTYPAAAKHHSARENPTPLMARARALHGRRDDRPCHRRGDRRGQPAVQDKQLQAPDGPTPGRADHHQGQPVRHPDAAEYRADGRQNAMSTALTQVKAQYKSKFAALQAQEQQVAGMRAKLNRELGVVQSSTISQDGVYVVDKDIPAGVYHTSGAGANSQPGGDCYFATLNSTNTEDITDNNNF